ncbi:MAG: LamG domain-containing protein, partial [Flavobacteriaceae bacterium]
MNNNTKRTLINQAPKLFTTQFRRGQTPLGSSGASLPGYTTAASWITDVSESVYKYNPAGSGLKSTQQLNVDWSKFENHTFFNSAQVKTNVAFQKIFDEFPFDGTREKIENFLAGLTGFEKYVYDMVPKEKHYQFFSGSAPTEAHGGTYIITNDASGVQYTELSTNKDALPAIDPGTNSLTIEAHLYPVDDLQPLEYLVDKFNSVNNIGFYISLEQTTPGQKDIKFSVTSGSLTKEVTGTVPTDTWSHFAFVWDRTPYMNKIMFYLNGELQTESENVIELGPIFSGADLIIGTGFQDLGANIPSFSGSLDEFRLWHVPRNEEDFLNYMQKSVFPNSDLKLYYKFNEPSTVDTPVVIDSSLNSLHGKLSATGMALGIRNNPIYETIVGDSPMTYEDLKYAPVLFPQYYKNQDLMNELLAAAKIYDGANPNLITKLIPKHYLLEGQYYDGYSTLQGDIVNSLVSGRDPRSARLGGTQALLMLLYTWAKFFDEMKLYIQAFSDLDFVDYNLTDTVPDDFLLAFAKRSGIALPPLFQGATIEQFVDGENIQDNISTNDMPLKQVQNLIWRRILINMRDFMTSKGTMHS